MRNSFLQYAASRRLLAAGGLAGLIAAVGVGLLGGPRAALARQTTPALTIFQGETTAQAAGLQLSSWGSGSITEDQKNAYNNGKESLRVVTHGQFQGAALRLTKPVDLGAFVANKSAYLQVALLFPERNGTGGFPGNGGLGGGKFGGTGGGGFPGGPPGGGIPGGGFPGGPPGGGGIPGSAGGAGGRPGGPQAFGNARAIENVRMVLGRSGGRGTEIMLPVSSSVPDKSWRLLSVPVGSIPGITADNAKFSEIRLFGDNPGVMYVGRIAVVVDSTPIKVEPLNDMNVEVRRPYRYTGSAYAGPSPLIYSWDWDNADGIQEESAGRAVTHTYYKEGDITGTLTVKDPYGVKDPVSIKFKVHVHL